MYSWIVRRALGQVVRQINSGDVPALMKRVGDDMLLVFPGESSFAGEYRGKDEIEAWLRRFVALKPSFELHDAAVAGPPWNMRVSFRFSDRIAAPDGWEYRNTGAEWLRIRGGKIREQRVYLDTQRVAELDTHLEPAAA